MGRLTGKRALITASAAGIGQAITLAFAAEGADVLATDIDLDGLRRLAPLGRLQFALLDVRETTAVDQLIALQGPFDVLINVAGYVHTGTVLDCSDDVWANSFDLNVASMNRTIRSVLPGMLTKGAGSIVNIASVASSIMGVANRYVYSATKGAVIGLTKAVAVDYGSRGIRCNAVCPGTIDTPSLGERLQAFADPDSAKREFSSRQLMGRLGKPEEVAALVVYLASDDASFTTGAVHIVDGGWSA